MKLQNFLYGLFALLFIAGVIYFFQYQKPQDVVPQNAPGTSTETVAEESNVTAEPSEQPAEKPSGDSAETLTQDQMNISSTAFQQRGNIPAKYTCDAENVSPPLEITTVPEGTASLALIVFDPDAPSKEWVHWLMWNIDPNTKIIPEGGLAAGAVEGTTDFGKPGYGGPCPPSGSHRYFFQLFALDTKIDIPVESTRTDLEDAIRDHVIEGTELVGVYQRS